MRRYFVKNEHTLYIQESEAAVTLAGLLDRIGAPEEAIREEAEVIRRITYNRDLNHRFQH